MAEEVDEAADAAVGDGDGKARRVLEAWVASVRSLLPMTRMRRMIPSERMAAAGDGVERRRCLVEMPMDRRLASASSGRRRSGLGASSEAEDADAPRGWNRSLLLLLSTSKSTN